jgi:hypothetical protein
MARTIILRVGALGCLAVFAAAIYVHSQPALVGSVLVAIVLGIVGIWSQPRIPKVGQQQRLRELAQEYLEPGEVVQAAFMALSGAGPYLLLIAIVFTIPLTILFGPAGQALMLWVGRFTTLWSIIATDRAILLFRTIRDPETDVLEARLPRYTRFGPVSGWWAMIRLNGMDMFVLRRFHADVELADRLIGARPPL